MSLQLHTGDTGLDNMRPVPCNKPDFLAWVPHTCPHPHELGTHRPVGRSVST